MTSIIKSPVIAGVVALACCLNVQTLLAQPTSQELTEKANECRELLKSSVVDFYLPSVDDEFGGYLQDLADDGSFTMKSEKFLVFQARQLWMFSELAKANIEREKSLVAANSGFDFIQNHFRDVQHGGYFSQVARDGKVADSRKHSYLNSFVIYAFVSYYEATQNQAALGAANRLFELLEEHAYDREFGGYQEFFYADWTPNTDLSEPRYVGAINTKTYNTHLHLLEAFTELYRIAPQSLLRQRLSELVVINTSTVRHPVHSCNIDGWTRDWKMIEEKANLRQSYGHDVECVWLVMRAADSLQMERSVLTGWAKSLVDSSLQHGFDEKRGGLYGGGAVGEAADDTTKVWWVQCEALVSMLEMFALTGEDKYMAAFEETYDFCREHQIAKQGGWWASLLADGSEDKRNTATTSQWQAGYHNGRALLYAARLLESIADESKN